MTQTPDTQNQTDPILSEQPANLKSAGMNILAAVGMFVSLNYLIRRYFLDQPPTLAETLFLAVFFGLFYGYFQYRAAKRSAYTMTAKTIKTSGGAEIAVAQITQVTRKRNMLILQLKGGRRLALTHLTDAPKLADQIAALIRNDDAMGDA